MSCLSIKPEHTKGYVVLVNPVFVTSKTEWNITFEVLAEDARPLEDMVEKHASYAMDDEVFWGVVRNLRECESSHPGLALLRHRPCVAGELAIIPEGTGRQ